MPTTSFLKRSMVKGVQILSLNRPPVNAFNKAFLTELANAYEEADADSNVKGVLVTSALPCFSAGLDIVELSSLTNREDLYSLVNSLNRMARGPLRMAKPIACLVEGHAIAAGAYLALSCDHVVLQKPGPVKKGKIPVYKIGLTEVPVGIPFPDHALSVVRHRIRGSRELRELIYVGETMTPEQAFTKGFGDALEANGEEAAWRWLERMMSYAPGVFTHTKRQMNAFYFRMIQESDPTLTMMKSVEERDLPVVKAMANFGGGEGKDAKGKAPNQDTML